MSKTIDERVVSMQFDNKQFETNVRTSMSTLEKLKQSLNLTGAAKGLDNINASAKSCNLSPLSNAAETVKVKFSALEVAAVTAIANITNSAVNAGKRIVTALTVQPPKDGFAEYENQINSVQTIMANTGEDVKTVNAALDELNEYADLTIYNFATMTQNAGMFTAAMGEGSLEKTMIALKGIGNWAAYAGANTQQMGNATYQLGQALSAGAIRLQDWMSIEKAAGMGGAKYREEFMKTARQHGINVDAMIKKNGSFRESLREGWLTTDIFIETLERFANDQAMTDAATKVKTFTQLIDTLKEALGTGWATTWRTIIGDYDEAKTLWTGVSDTLSGIIGRSADSRNKLLKGALLSNWDKMIEKITKAGVSNEKFEKSLKSTLSGKGYNVDNLIEKYGSLEEVFTSGAVSSDILNEAVKSLEGSLLDLSDIQTLLKKGNTGDDVKKVQQALKDLGYDLGKWDVDGIIGSKTEAAIKEFQKTAGITIDGIVGPETIKALEEASGGVEGLSNSVKDLISDIDKLGGRDLLIKSFKNIWEAIQRIIGPIKRAWREIFPKVTSEQLYNLIEGFEKFTSKLKLNSTQMINLKKTFKGLFAILDVVKTLVGGGITGAFRLLSKILGAFDLNILDVTASIGDALVKFRDWIFDGDRLNKIFSALAKGIQIAYNAIKNLIEAFINLPKVQSAIAKIKDVFDSVIDTIGNLSFEDIRKFFETDMLGYLKKIDIKTLFGNIGEFFRTDILGALQKFDIKTVFNNILGVFKGFKDKVKEYLGEAGIKFDEIKGKISDFIDTIKEKIGEHKGAIVAFGFLLGLILILSKIKKLLSTISGAFDSFAGIGESIQTFIDSFTQINKAKAQKIKTEAIYNIAKSLTLLAGALWIISKIEDPWKAVGVMGALAAGLLAMMAITQLISKINKTSSAKDIFSFGSMMRNLGIALILMTVAVKVLGGMDRDKLIQGGIAVGAFLGMMAILMLFTKVIGQNDIAQFGKMMRKLSISLLFLAAAVYIFGSMKTETLIQGGIAVTVFLGIMTVIMKMSSNISKDANAFGKMIRNISFSLLILAGVVAIFGHMDTEVLIKGGLAVIAFLGIMIIAMRYTSSISKESASFGKMMLSIGASLLLMAWAIKILGEMDTHTLLKGGIVVAGFLVIVVGLMKATSLLGRHSYNAGKMGLLLLSFAGSVLLITASIVALSMIDGPKLIKALAAVAGIGVILAGMLAITKFAKNIETGTIIALAAAVAIMAGSIVALTFVDPKDLRNATIALGAIIGMFSLLAYASRFVKMGSVISLAGLMLVVTGVAYLMVELANSVENADEAIKAAKAIAILIGTLSVACLALSAASKFGPKSFKGLLVLAGMMGIITLFAGIAIWQLPNIGTQLSKFMENLKPFLDGAKGIKPEVIESLKILGEAMLMFTGAGAIHAAINAITFGGVTRAFANFASFIKEVVPIVKNLALDVSGDGIKINTANLNAVIEAVAGLAEAASKVPTTKVAVALGGGNGIFGLATAISVPQLKEFTSWMKEVIPAIKDLALEVSGKGININGDAIASICNGVAILAEAADKAPKIQGAAGGAGGAGFGAGFLAISWPQLSKFANWLEGVIPIMTNFAVTISESKIKASDTENLISICEGVKALAEAADTAPEENYLVGVGGGYGFGGFFVGINKTDLEQFKNWIENVIPIMTTLTTTISESKIKASDTENLISICEGVKALAAAADTAPKIEGGIGLGFGHGFGGFFAGISIPQLEEFTSWLDGVIPIMTGFTASISESKIKASDTDNLKSICEGVKALGEAAGTAPTEDYIVGGGLGLSFGGGFAGVSVPQLEEFTSWLEGVIPVMTGFATTISESKIKSSDSDNLKSICEGVKVLSEAADNAPGIEGGGGLAVIGPVIAAGGYVKSTDLSAFKDWIVAVAPIMASFSVDISKAEITQEDATNIKSICEAVKILAEAAQAGATTKEEIYGISLLGAYSSIKTTDIEGFRDFLAGGEDGEGVVSVMNDLATNVDTLSFTTEDGEKINQLCRAIRTLGEAASLAPTKEEIDGWFSDKTVETDLSGFKTWIEDMITTLNDIGAELANSEVQIDTAKLLALSESAKLLSQGIEAFSSALNVQIFQPELFSEAASGVADAMVDFSEKVAEINHTALASAAGAARDIAETFSIATSYGSDYSSVDTEAFKTKAIELGEAIKEFASNMEGVDVSSATLQVTSLAASIGALSNTNFDGANDLVKAIEALGTASVDELVDALSDADKLSSAGTSIITNLVTGITESAGSLKEALNQVCMNAYSTTAAMSALFIPAGTLMATSLASGISSGIGTVKAAVSTVAKNSATGVKSVNRDFYSAGRNVVTGFANGISDSAWLAREKAKLMARAALEAAKRVLNEHSPSKETYKVGAFFVKGFTNGIDAYAKNAANSGKEIAESAKRGLSNAISKVGTFVENGIDSQPTIRPVLDMSDIESGVGVINGMFGMAPSIRTLSNIGSINAMMNRSQNGVTNSDVVDAIENLGKKIGKMSGDTIQINGVTYDDGSNLNDAVRTIVRAARIERRR